MSLSNLDRTTVKETFAVMTVRDDVMLSGWMTERAAKLFQRRWLRKGRPVSPRSRVGWVYDGVTWGGRIEILTDTVIVKRIEISVDQPLPNSRMELRDFERSMP